MHISGIEIHDAATLEEAAELKEEHGPEARFLAGGTDLLVDLKTGRVSCRHVISIHRLDALRGVTATKDGLRIGALTTVSRLARDRHIRGRFAAILDAATRMAAPQIRNVATVGGNIASAVPCADLPPILMCMHASCVLRSRQGERSVPLESFFRDVRKTELRDGEVLTAVHVPHPPAGFGAAYARFALRDGNAIAVAAVAVGLRLDGNGCVERARLALAAVSPIPMLVSEAGDAVVGRPLDDETLDRAAAAAMRAAKPITDVRGSAEFRREIVGVLARRALCLAARRAGEGTA